MMIYSVVMKGYTMCARETIYNFKSAAAREEFLKTLKDSKVIYKTYEKNI